MTGASEKARAGLFGAAKGGRPKAKLKVFKYKAETVEGTTYSSTIAAPTLEEAREKLARQGTNVLELREAAFYEKSVGSSKGPGPDDMALLATMYGVLLNTPMSHPDVAEMVSLSAENPRVQAATYDISVQVREGTPLPQAMKAHPEVYDGSFSALTEAALNSKREHREIVFQRLAESYELISELNGAIRNALVQPAITILIMIAVVGGLMVMVIPQFEDIFAGMDIELPVVTQGLIAISNFLTSPWAILLLVMTAAGVFFLWRYTKTEDGRAAQDRLLLKLPLISPIIRYGSLGKALRTLGVLLAAGGTSEADALRMAGQAAGNVVLRDVFEEAAARRALGEPMHVTFQRHQEKVTPRVAGMSRVGSQSQNLPDMLLRAAKMFEGEVGQRSRSLSRVIEPIMFVTLGVVVLGIVLAVMMPLMGLVDAIQ